jgi:hypothetical protein
LLGCSLMMVLAVLLSGLYFLGILDELDRLVDLGDQLKGQAGEEKVALKEEERAFLDFGLRYVLVIGLVLLVLLAVAFMDLIALRRYGMRHRRRIREDREAMLRRQLPLLRREQNRNGHG